MAKMKRNIGDYVSGKIGNVVFVQMKGKSYVRSAPHRTNIAWSESQIYHRHKLSNVAKMWRNINSEEMKHIWKLASNDLSNYAWFVKKNINAFSISGELIDPMLIQVVDGKLTNPLFKITNAFLNSKFNIEWINDPNIKKKRLNDHLMIMTYYNNNFTSMSDTNIKRSDLTAEINKPMPDAITQLGHVYFFFASTDNCNYSPSIHFEISY